MQNYAETRDKRAKMNPLRAVRRAKALATSKLDEVRKAAREGRLVAWGNGPTELLEPMGIPYVQLGNYSTQANRAGIARLFSEVAEAEGFSPDLCGHLRNSFGMALLVKRGRVDLIPEELRVPRPQFILSDGDCGPKIQRAKTLGEILNVPALLLEFPFTYQANHWERDMQYIAAQLQEVVGFLEEMTGRPYNWERLKELLLSYRRMNHFRRLLSEAGRRVPALADINDMSLCGGVFGQRSSPEAIASFYEGLNGELDERSRSGISAVSPEKYRMLWCGLPFRGQEENLQRMFAERGAVGVASSFTDRTFGFHNRQEIPPDGIDIERPLLTLAAHYSYIARSLDWHMNQGVYRYAEGCSLDAAVLLTQLTCRPYSWHIAEMREVIERELGIPALVLEGDHQDAKAVNTVELESRIQTFMEMLAAKGENAGYDRTSG